MNKVFGVLFIFTGTFAIIGGIYTWGEGSIFSQKDLLTVLIPWADIILTGPISLVSGYGILKKMNWARVLGLVTSGVYLFGSLLVFITIVWNNNYSILLLIPSIAGFFIGLGFTVISIGNPSGLLR